VWRSPRVEKPTGLVSDDAVHFNASPNLEGLNRCLRVDPKAAVDAARRGHPLTRGAYYLEDSGAREQPHPTISAQELAWDCHPATHYR